MTNVVRPLKFDAGRRAKRNETRRAARRRKDAELRRLHGAVLEILWFGFEPAKMWASNCFGRLPKNDNAKQS
jgi:hypothetical protein